MMMFMYEYVGSIHIFSEKYTSHEFLYDSNFAQLYKSECYGAIVDDRYYAPIFVLEEEKRTSKTTLKNVRRKSFEGIFIVDYEFKVTAN